MKREFLLGGFFLVIPSERAQYMDGALMPSKIVSVSNCICNIMPDSWYYTFRHSLSSSTLIFGISAKNPKFPLDKLYLVL